MRRTCPPGERERWWRELSSLPRERRAAVIRMLCEVIDSCHYCEDAVRRCDNRGRVRGNLAHLRCAPPQHLTRVQRDALDDREAQG